MGVFTSIRLHWGNSKFGESCVSKFDVSNCSVEDWFCSVDKNFKREHQKVVDETHQNAVQGVILATAVCNSSNAVWESVNQNWDLMPKLSMS